MKDKVGLKERNREDFERLAAMNTPVAAAQGESQIPFLLQSLSVVCGVSNAHY